jgi:hypothetical protein
MVSDAPTVQVMSLRWAPHHFNLVPLPFIGYLSSPLLGAHECVCVCVCVFVLYLRRYREPSVVLLQLYRGRYVAGGSNTETNSRRTFIPLETMT